MPGTHVALHEYQHEDGTIYRTGCLKQAYPGRIVSVQDGLPSMPLLDRNTLIDVIKDAGGKICLPYRGPIYMQGKWNWCWNEATLQMCQLLLDMLYGDNQLLSPSLGGAICVDYANEGDAIDSMLVKVLQPHGICTAAWMGDNPLTMKIVRPLKEGWQAEAAKRAKPQPFMADNFLVMGSGVVDGHPGVIGVDWQGQGHAIGFAEVGYNVDGLYGATPGTWSESFRSGWGSYPGKPGWYKLQEEEYSAAFNGGYGAYLLAGLTDSDAVPDLV